MAQQFVSSDKAIDAIIALLRASKFDEAVTTFTSFQEDLGYPLLNRIGSDAQLLKAMANVFFRARDYSKAAVCCENLGEHEKAGSLYEKSTEYDAAAEAFSRVGKQDKAAEMFERSEKFREAAELFVQVGDVARAAAAYEKAQMPLDAGKLYAKAGNDQKAMELLQQIPKEDGGQVEATLVVAEILEKNGQLELALRKLQALDLGRIDAYLAPAYYRRADLLAKKGMRAEATQAFADIVAWNFEYEDAQARMRELEKGGPLPDPKPMLTPPLKPAVKVVVEEDLPELDLSAFQTSIEVVSVLDGFEHFRELPLFDDLSLQEQKALYAHAERKAFVAGEKLIEQGQDGHALFVIVSGTVEVRKRSPNGETALIATIGPGEFFGEMSLVDDAPASAEVHATSEGEALAISRKVFRDFLASSDHVAHVLYREFVKKLCARLRSANEQLARVAS